MHEIHGGSDFGLNADPGIRLSWVGQYPRGGGGGTLIFSHIRRLCPFFGVQNSEFQYFLGFSEK